MTKNNYLKTVTFFIILVTYQVLHGEGRQIKSLAKTVNQNRIPSQQTGHSTLGSTTSISFIEVKMVETDAQGHKCPGVKCLHDLHTTTLAHSPKTGHSYLTSYSQGVESEKNTKTEKIDERLLLNLPTPMKVFSDSKVISENNFLPTPPGRSPGAGHPETNIKDTAPKQHSLDEKCTGGIHSITPADRTEADHFVITKTKTKNHKGKKMQAAHSNAEEKDDYPPTAPGHSPGAGHPQVARPHAGEKDDYPPTTPGHSPGAGHPQVPHPHTGEKDDYPPTTPGRSPGAGHPHAEEKDDYPPTAPGQSPGAGHPILKN